IDVFSCRTSVPDITRSKQNLIGRNLGKKLSLYINKIPGIPDIYFPLRAIENNSISANDNYFLSSQSRHHFSLSSARYFYFGRIFQNKKPIEVDVGNKIPIYQV